MGLFGFSENKAMGRVDTLIGVDSSLRGSYNSKNSLRIDGEVYGNVTCEDGIIVGLKGMVRGNLIGKSILVGGKVKGNITAYQKLEVQNTAEIEGDISTPLLVVEEGAIFEGNCQMEEVSKVVDLPKTKEN
ncbi:MAG TPA: polymer-forming cytoskeletal protein [bacterium]|nr:polymer-forming cytoskeletal protein [bacterium]